MSESGSGPTGADDGAAGEWPLKRLMTEVVGSGPKSAEDMTYEQARGAMTRILDCEPDPTTLGAFWLANRWKRNTPEELAGFVDAVDERSHAAVPEADPVDCGANYDGKRESALLGVASGLVAAAAGTPVVVHSGDRVPTHEACAYKHVLDALGVVTDLAPAESARMVDHVGFGFYYQPRYAPAVHALLERRERMGVRTFVNTVETLCNPADARVHLGSFYHLSFARRMIDTLAHSRSSAFKRVLMFQGMEGYDDVRPGYTKVAEWGRLPGTEGEGESISNATGNGRNDGETTEGEDDGSADGAVEDYEIETASYGMALDADDLAVEDVPRDSAHLTEAVLAGEQTGDVADAVALNAALRIYAGDAVDTIEAGLDQARAAITSGAARERLDALQAFAPRKEDSR